MPTVTRSLQEIYAPNGRCFGCGPANAQGLRIRSFPTDDTVDAHVVCEFHPAPFHEAFENVLNGGIIATLLDCHGVCTAIADAYAREGRAIGSEPDLWYATASMGVDYLRPVPIDAVVTLRGRVVDVEGRSTTVECELDADGKLRATASVRAVRVPDSWRHGTPHA